MKEAATLGSSVGTGPHGSRVGRLSRLAANATSTLASDVASRVTTFAIYVLVARFLGAFELGQLSIALTFLYLGQVLAVAGLRTLLTRELAREPQLAPRYAAAGALVAGSAALGSLLLISAVVLALGYSGSTTVVVLLVVASVPPFALGAVAEGMLQARERMTLIAAATVPGNIVKLAGAVTLLVAGADLRSVALLLVACQYAICAAEWVLAVRYVAVPRRPDRAVVRRLAGASMPFLGIDCLSAVTASANVVILSKLLDEQAVGFYSMAAQLLVPLGLVSRNVLLAAFPLMCARYEAGDRRGLERASRALFRLMLALGLAAAVALFTLAPQILHLLYGDRATDSAVSILRLLAWTAVLTPLTAVLGQVLYACLRERLNLGVTLVDAVLSVVLGIALVSWLGLPGAAWATLGVALVDFALHWVLVRRVLPDLRVLRPPRNGQVHRSPPSPPPSPRPQGG